MTYSYLGLVAAALSETATRLPITRPTGGPGLAFALAVILASVLVFVVGGRMIRGRATPLLSPFRK